MNQLQPDEDKRDLRRIPKEISIEISKLSYPLPKTPQDKGIGRNIGGGGICLTASAPYEPNTVLSLKINIGGWHGYKRPYSKILDMSSAAPLTAIGEVIWCKEMPNGAEYEIGIKFVDIYEDDYRAFMKYLEEGA